MDPNQQYTHWQYRLHEIIFEADTRAAQKGVTTQACPECMAEGHDPDARFCKHCAAQFNSSPGEEITR